MSEIIREFRNRDDTVGIIRIPDKKGLVKLSGYFNKELVAKMVELTQLFGVRDMSVWYENRGDAAVLLFCPNEDSDLFIAVTGKTEVEI
jgi:hypothetical protein